MIASGAAGSTLSYSQMAQTLSVLSDLLKKVSELIGQ